MSPENRRGVALMCAAMGGFVVNDALVKLASAQLPFGQLVFLRGVFALGWILLAMRLSAQRLQPRLLLDRVVLGRSVVDACGSAAYLLSLFQLPLANATAINMAAPLVTTLLAAAWFGERVSARSLLAVGLGFAGVLLVIQPRSEGFNAYAWLCLAATLFHATRDLLTRKVASGVSSLHITLAGALCVTLGAGFISLLQGWVALPPRLLGVLLLASLFLALGYHCIIGAMRQGQVAVVTPFRYSALLFALVLGWAVWGTLPNATAWAGIALLMASGLYLLRSRTA